MSVKYIVLGIILLLIGVGLIYRLRPKEVIRENPEITIEFIQRWLQNENGTIATYIQEKTELDEDLVQGREALAETVGLLMLYALQKEDKELFDQYHQQFNEYFLRSDGFVNWKINEEGVSEVTTNALIDDLRIMDALVLAYEKWGGSQYLNMAGAIGDYLTDHNVNNGRYTNFYESKDDYASEKIKLSYIDLKAMNDLANYGLLDADAASKTSQVLTDAPLKNGFYPISYNVVTHEYTYDENVNILDQAIIAYHLVQIGEPSEELLVFIQNEIKNRKIVHGKYHLETKEPSIDYESPAIYGYLVSYARLAGKDKLAEALYRQMKETKNH